jgi:hypothetical protein
VSALGGSKVNYLVSVAVTGSQGSVALSVAAPAAVRDLATDSLQLLASALTASALFGTHALLTSSC